MEEEEDDDDEAAQYMIEQSLLESNKQKGTHRDAAARDSRRSVGEDSLTIRVHDCTIGPCFWTFSFTTLLSDQST